MVHGARFMVWWACMRFRPCMEHRRWNGEGTELHAARSSAEIVSDRDRETDMQTAPPAPSPCALRPRPRSRPRSRPHPRPSSLSALSGEAPAGVQVPGSGGQGVHRGVGDERYAHHQGRAVPREGDRRLHGRGQGPRDRPHLPRGLRRPPLLLDHSGQLGLRRAGWARGDARACPSLHSGWCFEIAAAGRGAWRGSASVLSSPESYLTSMTTRPPRPHPSLQH
mmetsp:Transcript_64137/g.177260  ORF Transcript_64137/g.177260 Transcript_64137/m.177260 type:complete len:223 (+) Transcript_64137:468-1136(+)